MSFVTRKITKTLFAQAPRYYLYLHEYQAYDLLKKYKLNLIPVHPILSRVSEPTLLRMQRPSPRE